MIIAGDLNARTGGLTDFILDNYDDSSSDQLDYDEFSQQRNSKDMQANNFGRVLVDLCCKLNVHILNGRFDGDKYGEFTCCTAQGVSIVDYIIASTSLFKFVKNFTVGTVDISDHFPISCQVAFPTRTRVNSLNNIADSVTFPWQRCYWKPQLVDVFLDHMQDTVAQDQFTEFESRLANHGDTDSAVNILNDILIRASRGMCRFYSTNNQNTRNKNAPWWDNECQAVRKEKFKKLKKFRESNNAI